MSEATKDQRPAGTPFMGASRLTKSQGIRRFQDPNRNPIGALHGGNFQSGIRTRGSWATGAFLPLTADMKPDGHWHQGHSTHPASRYVVDPTRVYFRC